MSNVHALAGQNHGLEGVGQIVDVEHFNVVQVGHLVQVEVVGDDLGLPLLGQLQQLEVDFADGGKIVGDDLNLELGVGLHALQHVKAAAAALALGTIGGVGHHLELAEHELRHHQRAVDKAGFGDVGNAPVDDDASVQDFGAAARWAGR